MQLVFCHWDFLAPALYVGALLAPDPPCPRHHEEALLIPLSFCRFLPGYLSTEMPGREGEDETGGDIGKEEERRGEKEREVKR